MLRNNKGSVTIMVFVAMLFISLYGALVLGNSARKYQNQTNNINTIINSYRFQGGGNPTPNGQKISQQELEILYENVGGEVIEVH
jgi:hypothetical protein